MILFKPNKMFIGHFGIGLGAKGIDRRPSLGFFFFAAVWPDLLWPVLLLTGAEKVSIDPGNTRLSPLNFQYYPWSHSMLLDFLWGVLFGIVYYKISKNKRGSILIGVLVFSHWVLDLLVHGPDLQITPFSETRVGLGLWNYEGIEITIETFLFLVGVLIYLRSTKPKNNIGIWLFWLFVAFLVGFFFMNVFGTPPSNVLLLEWIALGQWFLVAWGFWIDRNRISNNSDN